MNLLYYLAEANLYLGVFYLAYCLLLTNETHYQLNRAYLLFSCMAAFVLPVLQIGVLKPVEAAVNTTINYAIPEYTEPLPVANYINTEPVIVEHHLTLQDYLVYIYLLGACIVFVLLMVKLFNLFKLMRNAQTVDHLKYKVVYLPGSDIAFSFFNHLFIGTNAPGTNTIVRHELVHIRQKHSFDIVFLELLKVVSWFNPFVYLLQNSLKTVHEYIADEQTAAHETDALTYSTFLVNNAYGTGGSSITHSFFNYNLLKKRIIMLNQQRSGSLARLKYLVTVPICVGLLCTSTLAFSKTYGWVDLDPATPVNVKPGPQRTIKPETSIIKGKLIIVDGKIYSPKPEETVAADSMVDVPANTAWAIKKWGNKAKNGVRLFTGHATIIKKANSPLTRTDKYGGRVSPGKLTNAMVPITTMIKADPKLLFIVNGKKFNLNITKLTEKELIAITCDSMTVYEKGNTYAKSKWGNDVGQVTVLHGNASLKLVDAPDETGAPNVKFPPPIITLNTDLTVPRVLLKYLADNISYPKGALDNNIQLRARVIFNVINNKITEVKVTKGAILGLVSAKVGDDAASAVKPFEIEILQALKRYSTTDIVPGSYSLPIYFAIVKDNSVNLISDNMVMKAGNRLVAEPELIIKGYKKGDALSSIERTDSVAKPDWNKLGEYFSRNIHYAAIDRKQHTAGRVITIFAVDDNHNLQYAKVLRSPSDAMANEIIRVLKKCTEFYMLKPGMQYTLPISFTLDNENIGNAPPLTQRLPKDHDPNSGVYNPNSIDIKNSPAGLMLNETVIRGYTKSD
jgi:hypothetical protein